MMRWQIAGWVVLVGLCSSARSQGTKLWSVDRYDEFAKGTAVGVAIRSDGRLEAGPATSLLYATGGSYVWSLAADSAGNAYAGQGGTTAASAIVMKIAPDGTTSKFFEGKELGVQAVRVLTDRSVAVATSPDGKLYRIAAAGGTPTVLFDPATTAEKPKYLWDVVEIGSSLFVATGAPAAVYRVPENGEKAGLLFRTTDQHIRCLLPTANGTLWAGSDGSGVIYRIATSQPAAEPFAAYAAPKREITALAADAQGDIYAAGVGTKGASSLPPLPVTGNLGVSITFVQPGSATATSTNTLVPEGSEIYRIGADGTPSKLLALGEDVVYALAFHKGTLLAATGNRGHVYSIEINPIETDPKATARADTAAQGRFTEIAHLEASQGMAFTPIQDGVLIATSNSGKLFKLRDRLTSPASYTSTVFDAQRFAQWGRAEVRSETSPAFDLYAHSGNVESPLMGWSPWARVVPDAASIGVPAARFVQWKAVLREGGTVDAVGLNYLQANVAPVVDEVAVQPGARVAVNTSVQPAATVQVGFPAPASLNPISTLQPDLNTGPLTAQKDKTAVTVRWSAHDENGDTLTFGIFYRGVGEANWHLLKDKISERFYSFDSSLLPDGGYTLKVTASDAPVHTDSEALKGAKESGVFVIDTTPPIPGTLVASIEKKAQRSANELRIHARLEVHDATSPIAQAEYSVDAGPWQYLEPVGRVSDSQTEQYDFVADLPARTAPVTNPGEHLIAIRVYDRYDNVASVKAIVR